MANYRQIHVKIWKDNWFLDLIPEEKLLWVYLFSNDLTSLSGIYQISQKVIAFETGLDIDWVADTLKNFQSQSKLEYEDGYIWIKKLRKYHETSSPKVQTHIRNDLDSIPDIPLKTRYIAYYQPDIPYTYPMDTESQEEEEEVKEEKEEEVERAPAPAASIPFSDPKTAQAFSAMQDHTSQDVAQLYRDVTGQMQPLSANIDKAFSDLELVLDFYPSAEDAIAPGKYIYDLWCQKRSAKTGKTYSPLNIAWIEKWLENLARDSVKEKVAEQRERSFKSKTDADINRVAKKLSL